MFKIFAITMALFVATQGLTIGGFQPTQVTDEVLSIAKWSASQLSSYTNLEGDHTVMTVRNLKTQIVSGINYKFDLDVLVQTPENKFFFRSCAVSVYDQPWTNTRVFNQAPVCGPHPNFQ